MELLPCPFCGLQINDEDPRSYIHFQQRNGLYQLCCLEEAGGCTASVLGRSREEVVKRWNTRVR